MENQNNQEEKNKDNDEVIEVEPEEPRKANAVEVQPSAPQKPVVCPAPKRPNIIIGTLNVFASPAKALAAPAVEMAKKRYHRHYHPRHRHGRKHLVADLILAGAVLFLIALNIYAFWGDSSLVLGVKIDISTAAPSISSGDEITFVIDYLNNNKVRLDETKLSLKLPAHFVLKKVTPQAGFDSKTNTFEIGHLEPGANGQVKITGQVLGKVADKQTLVVYFNYLQEESNRREQKVASYKYNIDDSSLMVDLVLPKSVVNNQEFDLEIKYRNNSQADLGQMNLVPDWPMGFKMISSEPAPENGAWTIQVLGAGETKTIKVRGLSAGQGETSQEFKIKPYLVRDSEELLQKEVSKQIGLFYPKFFIKYKINGQDNLNISLGDTLEYTLVYENGEESNVIDAAISLSLAQDIFELTALEGAGVYKDGAILWNKDNFEKLALVRPKEKGEIKFKIRVRQKIDARKIFAAGARFVKAQAKAEYRLENNLSEIIPAPGPVLESKLNSDLALQSFGRYYTLEGDQLGRGPLPPQAGLKTSYWAFFHILNSINDLEDVVITASLPDYVEWTGKSSVTLGDPLKFDPVSRQLSWRVKKVDKLAGDIYPDVGVALEIAITPRLEHDGVSPVLIKDIKISAKDSFTNEFLERSGENITTDLKYDKKIRANEKVVK